MEYSSAIKRNLEPVRWLSKEIRVPAAKLTTESDT